MAQSNESRSKGGFADNPGNINRAGRPKKGQSMSEVLERVLEEMAGSTQMEKKEAICRQLLKMAFDGDIRAIKEVFNRVDGLPVAKIQSEGDGEFVVRHEIVGARDDDDGDV